MIETNSIPSDDMIRKVRAMVDKANSTDNMHEQDAFMKNAARIAAKHHVTTAMISDAAPLDREVPVKVEIKVPSKYSKEHASFVCVLARGIGARGIMHPSGEGKRGYRSATVVGFKAQLESVQMLYLALAPTLVKVFRSPGSQNYKVNLSIAFMRTIEDRLVSELAKAVEEHDSDAVQEDTGRSQATVGAGMVLADRSLKVQKGFVEFFPKSSSVTSKRRYDTQASSKGKAMGRSADLNTRSRLGK
jgi:hypothetical protein